MVRAGAADGPRHRRTGRPELAVMGVIGVDVFICILFYVFFDVYVRFKMSIIVVGVAMSC